LWAVTGYSYRSAARILKVSPARLRYWERTELMRPRSQDAVGDLEFRDLVGVKAVLSLLERGISLQRIRRSVEILRQDLPDLEDPVAALRLWCDGSERMVVEHDGVLIEPGGQMVLDFQGAAGGQPEVRPIRDAGTDAEDRKQSALDCFELGCGFDSNAESYPQAIEAYRRAIELDPTLADAHCNLGAVLYNQGRRTPSRRCFERCLELEPNHVEAHFNLANLLEEEGCDEMALRHYTSALRANPFYPDLHINLALLYEKLEMCDRACEHWRRYLQLESAGPWVDVARQRLERADS
jgi:tetratricopeptide (TPR) repeat protein